MVDEMRSNLEPIEDGDLETKDKFIGKEEGERVKLKDVNVENIQSKENISERKEGVQENEKSYSKILSKIPVTKKNKSDEEVKLDAKNIAEGDDAETKLEKLVKLAQFKGIFHAVSVAKHMENFYILDEFHDRLLEDELYNALIKKGLIKEI